jgi:hypothetical protein
MLDFLVWCSATVIAWPILSLVIIIPIILFRLIKYGFMLMGFVSPEDC